MKTEMESNNSAAVGSGPITEASNPFFLLPPSLLCGRKRVGLRRLVGQSSGFEGKTELLNLKVWWEQDSEHEEPTPLEHGGSVEAMWGQMWQHQTSGLHESHAVIQSAATT